MPFFHRVTNVSATLCIASDQGLPAISFDSSCYEGLYRCSFDRSATVILLWYKTMHSSGTVELIIPKFSFIAIGIENKVFARAFVLGNWHTKRLGVYQLLYL
jgi:hypothetical protein